MTQAQILSERGVRLPLTQAIAVVAISAEGQRLLQRVGLDAVDSDAEWTIASDVDAETRDKMLAFGVLATRASESLAASVTGEPASAVLVLQGEDGAMVCVLQTDAATLIAASTSEVADLLFSLVHAADQTGRDWGLARYEGEKALVLSRSQKMGYQVAVPETETPPGSVNEALLQLLSPPSR